jgi:uncharacterized tellurite resistance protein B-like protein
MVSIIKQFFEQYVKPEKAGTDEVSDHSLQIATAALLIEMMRADAEVSVDEQNAVMNSMSSKFNLLDKEIKALLNLAEEKVWDATGYFEFTSLMNKGFTYEQKIKVIEHLWEVAFADNLIDKHEEYMVRKIADLIYVSHKDFIDAKLRVKSRLET